MEENEFHKHIGEWADIGRKSKDGGVFFLHARLVAASQTHLFFQQNNGGIEGINLSEIARIQFKASTAPQAQTGGV